MPKVETQLQTTTCNVSIRDFPKHLWNCFHAWCTLRDKTMKEVLEQMIREKVKDTNV